MTVHQPLWARLDTALVGDGEVEPLRVGDTFVAGLAIWADRRTEAGTGDGLRPTDPSRGLYEATGVARSSDNHWVLDTGDLLLMTYQDPPAPTAGRRYTVHGPLAVAWDYEWDLASTEYDGRRRWVVGEIRSGTTQLASDETSPHAHSRSAGQVYRWSSGIRWLRLVSAGGDKRQE